MFLSFVFVCLLVLLVLASGAALYMGLFQSHRKSASFGKKALSGIISYGVSACVWFFMYSFHYLGW